MENSKLFISKNKMIVFIEDLMYIFINYELMKYNIFSCKLIKINKGESFC